MCVGADRRCGCPAGWALITWEIQCQCVPLGHVDAGWGCAGPCVQHDLPWHGQAENSHSCPAMEGNSGPWNLELLLVGRSCAAMEV